MKEALQEAQKAFAKGEVPVGAVAVLDGKIVARAHNLVESTVDASAHAELLCLRAAAKELGAWRLLGVTLYTTLEPCTLCAGALPLFRVKRVVWGASDIRQGAGGSFISFLGEGHPIHEVEVEGGVLAGESASLLKSFFKARREEKGEGNI